MTERKLIIAGTGFLEILSLIREINSSCTQSPIIIEGFIDDNIANKSRDLAGHAFLGTFNTISEFPNHYIINTIARSSRIRYLSTARLQSLGARFINLIHPSCTIAGTVTGQGNIISSGVCIEHGSAVGSHNLLLRNVIIGHDSQVENFCFLGHSTVVNGHSSIRSFSYVGASCVVGPSVVVHERSVVSPCCYISLDTSPNSMYVARPPQRLQSIPANSPHYWST